MKNTHQITTTKPAFDAAAYGRELTKQYAKACGAMREVLTFGAMMIRLREVVEFTCEHNSAKRGPSTKDSGIKAWLSENAPEINRTTAYRFLHVTEAVMSEFQCPAKISFVDLALTPAKALPSDRMREKQEELWDFVNGTSQRSWLDRFKPRPKLGGVYHPRRPKDGERPGPTGDPEKDYLLSLTESELEAHDLWWDCLQTLSREGIDKRSWMHLPEKELSALRGLVLDLNRLLRQADAPQPGDSIGRRPAPEDIFSDEEKFVDGDSE
jgi:hypothetical protein